ncbi:MAG: hypothetical protein PHH65_07125, partial [Eubacteriales bacterium]|nr:hypothetical protein [Eubacteriales bacterium]
TQDLAYRLMETGDHLYYCSTGLKRGVIKHRGSISLKCPYDYEREDGLCKVKWFDTRLVNPYDYMEFDDETECSL